MHNLASQGDGEFDAMEVALHFPDGVTIEVGVRQPSFESASYIALASFLAEALSAN